MKTAERFPFLQVQLLQACKALKGLKVNSRSMIQGQYARRINLKVDSSSIVGAEVLL